MELIVAEKPKVAEKIAYAICDKVERKNLHGVSYYIGIVDGKEVAVAPAVGHIFTLIEKKTTRTYPTFDIQWVPSHKGEKAAAYTKAYLETLASLGKKADLLTVACDYDIEGSLIGYNVYRFAYGKKAGARMKFSALTPSDLKQAYYEKEELDVNNALAGEARHMLDWYFGINLSRALMSAMRSANRFKVMSIGRVQGPALAILAELEKRIKAFVPTPYWEVTVRIKDVEFKHAKDRFTDEAEAQKSTDNTGKQGKIDSVEKREQVVWPNPPFDLTSLQVEAYRVFNFAPARTLELAQTLYEASLISYPRTSSQKLPAKLNLGSIVKKLADNPDYAESAKQIIADGKFSAFQGKKEDPAHPAIHPTGQKPGQLEEPERKLYDLIVRRFLSLFAAPAKKERTAVVADSNGEKYGASGVVTTEKGWIAHYAQYYKAEDNELPAFTQGETVALEKKKKTKKETKPPKRFTDASIISELEDRHLGTKATRATIVETLHKRGYLSGKSIEVSDYGLKVVEVLNKYAPDILDEQMTRKIEEEMEGIQEGKIDEQAVIDEGKQLLIKISEKFKKNEKNIGTELLGSLESTEKEQSQVGVCDKCGKQLRIIRLGGGRQFIGCNGYPECRNAYPLPGGAWVKTTDRVCATCGKPTVDVRMGKRPFSMCIDPKCPTKANWGKKKEEKKDGTTTQEATKPETKK